MAASHSASSSSTVSSDLSRASSLFSAGLDYYLTSQSESDSLRASEAAAYQARASRHRRPVKCEPQPAHSVLTSTIFPDELINPPLVTPAGSNALQVATTAMRLEDVNVYREASFVKPKQADGISLRNFRTQHSLYATVSDIVLYCPAGLHEGMINFAHWVQQAQENLHAERVERGLGGLRYNVFIIADPFEVFERHFPHLVAVDGSGFSRNRIDFVEREREEMQRFTEASEIDDNVFMGCTANVPMAMDEYDLEGSSASLDSFLPQDSNPHGFSVCIEAVELVDMPGTTQLMQASQILDAVESQGLMETTASAHLSSLEDEEVEEDDRPSLGPDGWSPSSKSQRSSGQCQRPQVMIPSPGNVVHLKALGSGSYFEDEESVDFAVEGFVSLCAWIYKQSRGPKHHSPNLFHGAWKYGRAMSWPKHQQQFSRRTLIHCGDGYTDTSILGLAYLMYARRLSLPEAYLDLQTRCNRCFFVYARDVPFLQRLEKRIALERPKHGITEKPRSSWTSFEDSSSSSLSLHKTRRNNPSSRRDSDYDACSIEQSVWARSLAAATGLVTAAQNVGNNKRSTDMIRTNTPTPRRSTPTSHSPHRELQSSVDHSWFTNPHFQGSFPSRILPFLYLGNLAHALNPAMLHALGITHVVSVGESALLPPSTEDNLYQAAAAVQNHTKPPRRSREHTVHKSLWEEERMGRISVLDLKNVSDDGIDSLRPHMNRAVEYIEQARLQGGKVLVHCRVGVSRSATICIAYVMAHCDLSMIESFLLVRSRRMNVLTQPTLLFVWELRGFEAHLANLKRSRQASRTAHSSEDAVMHEADDSDTFSLAALSISSTNSSQDQSTVRFGHKRPHSGAVGPHRSLGVRQSIFFDQDLHVDIGAGAGSVYGKSIANPSALAFNSGSLTNLDYRAARLTHGYFCKLLSELNARYMVA